jgi:DNA helicase-2/ATP-dependent DNA helicase PcrA
MPQYREEVSLEKLWADFNFTPNAGQRAAITHSDGPLLLTAGPGSGKTRVLLWRTVNLIVFHEVDPGEIFLATFTEKAARQLKQGLQHYLGHVTNLTGRRYDLSEMAIGTVHSICQQLLGDRRFSQGGTRRIVPRLMDQLGQYFYLNRQVWTGLMEHGDFIRHEEYGSFHEGHQFINGYLDPREEPYGSRHLAVQNAQRIFNRFSEEMVAHREVVSLTQEDERMLRLYDYYRSGLNEAYAARTDFSLLQNSLLSVLRRHLRTRKIFRHVIIDEYQDTNAIQEELYFLLAEGHRNICVVGDDDQALYRFRGATVENLVQFATRCAGRIGVKPRRINLQINYRSRKRIVDCYTRFMVKTDWSDGTDGHYRVMNKGVRAHSEDDNVSVVTPPRGANQEDTFAVIAERIRAMKESGCIQDYNQVACLFPSLKFRGETNAAVTRLINAFEAVGIPTYAPRAGRFLEVEEARAIFGLFLKVFNMPPRLDVASFSYQAFAGWMTDCRKLAETMIADAPELGEFIKLRRTEWKDRRTDFVVLQNFFASHGEELDSEFNPMLLRQLSELKKLTASTRRTLGRKAFSDLIRRRYLEGKPVDNAFVISRVTTVDWSLLDLFYQFMGFPHFKRMFDLAEAGTDEGPICNLSLVSGYLARYMEEYQTLITGRALHEDGFQHQFFNSFCYALYRLDESEYENPEDPFPKGRVPFLTIHQSKGLEFPVVILGNLYRRTHATNVLESKVRHLLGKEGEPIGRMSEFDNMRLFYVALSRAQNLLVLPQWKGSRVFGPLKCIQQMQLPNLSELDVRELPCAAIEANDIGHSYSYTGDYLSYLRCSRYYMIFRKYDFAPARSQGQLFGSLVHRTIEDLHLFLLEQLKDGGGGAQVQAAAEIKN